MHWNEFRLISIDFYVFLSNYLESYGNQPKVVYTNRLSHKIAVGLRLWITQAPPQRAAQATLGERGRRR